MFSNTTYRMDRIGRAKSLGLLITFFLVHSLHSIVPIISHVTGWCARAPAYSLVSYTAFHATLSLRAYGAEEVLP